jgi:hypothetical protein
VTSTFQFGAVLHWEGFEFEDGGDPKNKYLVVVGAKPGCDYILCLANTNRRHKHLKPGCNSDAGYYCIPGGGKDFFPDDTIIALKALQSPSAKLIQGGMERQITVRANLRADLARAIRNCLKMSVDISEEHIEMLS